MLELASLGANVLHNRSVEMAKRYFVPMEVLSSFSGNKGTMVKEVIKVESMQISGVARDNNVCRISLTSLPDVPGIAFKVFSLLSQQKINVDIILQSIGRGDTKDISFTTATSLAAQARELLENHREMLGYEEMIVNEDVSKVSVVGSGMVNNPGVAAKMFEALFEAGVNIQMISTSEIKVSVLIDKAQSEKAVAAVHDIFF
jgi:aspartate kinase